MTDYADLEIGLHRRDADSYSVELRFSQPESDADVRLVQRGPSLARFDFDQLHELALDDAAYGQCLSESLFADPGVQTAFAQARGAAQTQDVPLRLRLFIGPSAPELQGLRWEMQRVNTLEIAIPARDGQFSGTELLNAQTKGRWER